MSVVRLSILAAILVSSPPAFAADATTPGDVSAPYPTLRNLTVEWEISGDDDLDGVVTVRYRRQGTSSWYEGMPLMRVPSGSNQGFSWSNKHSGSIFDLVPGTSYEVELTLEDPDSGAATETLDVATRPIPYAAPDSTVRNVGPSDLGSALASAQPGEILLLQDGTYSGFDVDARGNESQPIVIRAANEGGAVVNGDIDAWGSAFVYFEGLTVYGEISLRETKNMVVRRCYVETDHSGIVAQYWPGEGGETENAYIADNVVIGSTGWSSGSVGANGSNAGEGIELSGPGNVICHNTVRGFRDAISTLEDEEAYRQTSIDIYNNDVYVGADDGIEADFCMGNCRIMRNRVTDSFVGMSSQPGLGGPTYFIKNEMYNIIYSPFKLHRGSKGDVALHNTVVKCGDAFAVFTGDTWSHAYFRNNLFIGGSGGGSYGGYSNGSGRVANLSGAASSCDFDYDGYGSIGTGSFSGNIGGDSFSSVSSMRSNTTEQHAIEVDMSVFAASVDFPQSPFSSWGLPDLRLASSANAVDAGVPIANINDGYAGTAPDLGAHELGSDVPIYGPRPSDPDPGDFDDPPGGDPDNGGGDPDNGAGDPDNGAGDPDNGDGGGDGGDSASADASSNTDAGEEVWIGVGCRGTRATTIVPIILLLACLVARRSARRSTK